MPLMNYGEWVKTVLVDITGDSLWKMEAYRLSLFVADLGWFDVTKLVGDKRTLDSAGQLYRALGSIEANISEGYSRGSGRDRARFYEYALGSARESRGWFFKGRHILGQAVVEHRIRLITHIVRLPLTMVPNQRSWNSALKEEGADYHINLEVPAGVDALANSLENVPMP